MRNRSTRGAITTFVVLGFIFGVGFFLENIISNTLKDFLTGLNLQFILQYDRIVWGVSVTLFVIMAIGLVILQNAQTDTPLSRRKGILKLFLDIATGILSFVSALLSNDVLNVKQINDWIQSHSPEAAGLLIALALLFILGKPFLGFWITANNLLGIRDVDVLLKEIRKRYTGHIGSEVEREKSLNSPMTQQRFMLTVEDVTAADVTPLPLVNDITTDEESSLPRGASTAPPGADAPRYQYDYGSTAFNVWTIFNQDFDVKRDQRQLLILGGPGGGKSTQTYFLDRNLERASRADFDKTWEKKYSFWRRQLRRVMFWSYQPPLYQIPRLPIMLDLSTWPNTHKLFDKWLVSETVSAYGVHRAAAEAWMKEGKFTPLLDGLDVMEVPEQIECVNMINEYLKQHPDMPLVICCREEEYHKIIRALLQRTIDGEYVQHEKLLLRHAVTLGLVSEDEVRDRLRNVRGLEAALTRFPDLLETLRTPLLLSLAIINAPSIRGDEDGKWTQKKWAGELFKEYVDHILGPGHQDIELALAWIGYDMQRADEPAEIVEPVDPDEINKTSTLVFQISGLQRGSLPAEWIRKEYDKSVRGFNNTIKLAIAGIIVVVAGITAWVYRQGGQKIFDSIAQQATHTSTPVSPDWGAVAIAIAIAGIVGAVGIGLGARSINTRDMNTRKERKINLQKFQDLDDPTGSATQPERVTLRDWLHKPIDTILLVLRIGLRIGVWQTLLIALLTAACITAIVELIEGPGPGRWAAPIIGLLVALFAALLIAPNSFLLRRWHRKDHPDHLVALALLQSIRTLLLYTLLGLVAGGIFADLLIAPFAGQSLSLLDTFIATLKVSVVTGLFGALTVGLLLGLPAALRKGGEDAALHMLLRKVVTKSEVTPEPILKFLEKACKGKLLRHEGTGYTFIVKSESLRDNFADLYSQRFRDTKAAKNAPNPPTTRDHKHHLDSIRFDDPRWSSPPWKNMSPDRKSKRCRCPHCSSKRSWLARVYSGWAKERPPRRRLEED